MSADDTFSRRKLLSTGARGLGGALFLGGASAQAANVAGANPQGEGATSHTGAAHSGHEEAVAAPAKTGGNYKPVVVPNGSKLPWKRVGDAKVFHLVAQEVDHEFAPGLKSKCWGYNGRVHGPCIEAVEGDKVRIYVTNRLPASTSVHWHSILLPSGMDGVAGLSQKAIPPGETYKYEFTLRQHGTAMYHSHQDEMTQIALGMTGTVVIHPRRVVRRVDRDYVLLLHEWRVDVGSSRPNPLEMTDFNLFTMNGKAFPATQPLLAQKGERVRIRIANLSPMSHHPIHLHGYHFWVTEAGGAPIAESAQYRDATVLVPVGSTRSIEFVADAPGDWALHCHMTHHVMNQMGHQFPNLVGVDTKDFDEKVARVLPGYMTMGTTGMEEDMSGMQVPRNSIPMLGAPGKHDYIGMGGMFAVLKVRDRLRGLKDPGWYENPPGTLARLARPEELKRDGIDVAKPAVALDETGADGEHG